MLAEARTRVLKLKAVPKLLGPAAFLHLTRKKHRILLCLHTAHGTQRAHTRMIMCPRPVPPALGTQS